MSERRRSPFDWSTAVIAVLAIVAAVTVYLRDGSERFRAILFNDFELYGSILAKMLAGCLIGAFVRFLLPREVVARWIGSESGLVGIVIATIVGAMLPGGPFTIYPVAGALLIAGADVGATCAFVISWTLLGYNRALIWEIPFFGADFVGWRILFSLPLPIVAGWLARLAWRLPAVRGRGEA